MDPGDQLIRWTIRLAMGCFAASLACAATGSQRCWQWRRLLWTAGCGLFWCHLLAGFHFYHHWSHAHAFTDTAKKTAAAIGWRFGWGIYFNHLFALVWTADAAWMWRAEATYHRRPWWLHWGIYCYLLFIAANGLIVFKTGPIRWTSVAVGAALLVWWFIQRRKSPTTEPTT